jgi:hypothetical protein
MPVPVLEPKDEAAELACKVALAALALNRAAAQQGGFVLSLWRLLLRIQHHLPAGCFF